MIAASGLVTGCALCIQSPLLDFVNQRPVADVQELGRENTVPVGLLERLQDRAPLNRLRSLARDRSQRAGRFPDSIRTVLVPAALSGDSGGDPREVQPAKRDHTLD